MISPSLIDDSETVARILHRDWVVDGQLQIYAFTLRQNETYISVNRLSVSSFENDVHDFIVAHPAYIYRAGSNTLSFRLAELNVGDVRKITVELGDSAIDLSVEVESRDSHTKSHAGIFTRIKGQNVKGGMHREVVLDKGKTVPIEAIQLKVQYALLDLSKLEECNIPDKGSVDDSAVVKE